MAYWETKNPAGVNLRGEQGERERLGAGNAPG
jgi:hypothetical protein